MLEKNKIMNVFKFLDLENDKNRKKILSIRTVQPQIKRKSFLPIKADNVTVEQKTVGHKDAKLE